MDVQAVSVEPVSTEDDFIPFISKLIEQLKALGIEGIYPDEYGKAAKLPSEAEERLIVELMTRNVDPDCTLGGFRPVIAENSVT